MPQKRKSPWQAVDKDQLGYESNFNPDGEFHDGPRTADNDKLLVPGEERAEETFA